MSREVPMPATLAASVRFAGFTGSDLLSISELGLHLGCSRTV